MPRKSATQTGFELIAGVLVVIIIGIFMFFKFVIENPVILLLVLALGVGIYWFWSNKKKIAAAKEAEKRLIEERERQEREKKRLEDILARESEWGKDLCQWLIENEYNPADTRTKSILAYLSEWEKRPVKIY